MKHKKSTCKAFACVGLSAMMAFATSCVPSDTGRSNYYTRGIGHYPGSPSEDFSPALKLNKEATYRNLALLRRAFHSSSYDYNLTAQLVTDGIVTDKMPPYLSVVTHEGGLPLREREWTIDEGPYSRNVLKGEEVFLQYGMHGWTEKSDEVRIKGFLSYDASVKIQGYEWCCEASNDGKSWTELGSVSQKGLPGKEMSMRTHSDPNKQTKQIVKKARRLDEQFTFKKVGDYAFYRVKMKMKGALEWSLMSVDFMEQDKRIGLMPSKFFHSAWMSKGTGKEWVYVDLGTQADFDKVRLHWVNKAVAGSIQISDDAKQWTDVAALPGGESAVDEIACKERARYVRICMDKPAQNAPYVLSELEVMGKGGLVAVPIRQAAPEGNKLSLNGGHWKLQRASQVDATGEQLSSDDFDDETWVTATVPATVLTSYKNVGAIPDPNYADQWFQISESFFNSNFWYRNEFDLPADFTREHLFLNLDGINWKANIFLNGKKVARQEGAFIRGQYDITELAKPGKNVLAVEIVMNSHIGAVKEKFQMNTDFNGGILGADNPTFHASIGWDWISTVRGRNTGIYNDVYLTTTGGVTVQDPYVQTVLNLPDTLATLTPEVMLTNHESSPVEGVLKGTIGSLKFEKKVQLAAGEKKRVFFQPDEFAQLKNQSMHLWWPKGYGEPYLYDAQFAFEVNGKISDQEEYKVGIRQMTFNEDDHVLKMYINGRRFIGRGGNWGFGEHNLNYRGREYDIAVAHHANMNFTMMRNWVGQIGDEELYEACDKYGVMIWQDFWLANPSDGPDPYDNKLFMSNADDYVMRIRRHPSIGIYCGRNEGYPPKVLDDALRQLVKDYQPGMHYISSSADDVVTGHGPYRAVPPKEYFTMKRGADKLHSERGMPNMMNYESLCRTLAPEDLWPQSGKWGQHDFTMEGAQHGKTFNALLENAFGAPKDAKEFADHAQWINYEGYRAMFESRSKNRKGLLLWMTHSCWPSMVWQTYDYYFDPTAAYFGCMKANEPLHIQFNPATEQVEVVNYSAGAHEQLSACLQIVSLEGKVVAQKEVKVKSMEDTTVECMSVDVPANITAVYFLKLTLKEQTQILSENFYVRGVEEGNYQALNQLPKVKLETKSTLHTQGETGTGEVVLKNTTNTPAFLIRINVVGDSDGDQILPMFYSDNFFSLLPGEEKRVQLHWKKEDTRGNRPEVRISGYNVE